MTARFPIAIHADWSAQVELSIFKTELGWFGLLGSGGRLCGVRIGHTQPDEVRQACLQGFGLSDIEIKLTDWQPDLRSRLQAFCQGEFDDFADIELVYRRPLPPFRREVLKATRRIPVGRTITYLELATQAGSPRAARAAGNSMATNIFPIIVPCHRVVGSGGQLGGFTAPGGLSLKQKLLALEANA